MIAQLHIMIYKKFKNLPLLHFFCLLQNLLRNAAKSGCQTNYTYIPDIDMVPNPAMDLQLEEFLATPEVLFPPHYCGHCWLTVTVTTTHKSECIMFTSIQARECGMCAYVVPTYEIAHDSPRLNIFNGRAIPTCVSGCPTTRQNCWRWWGRSRHGSSTRRSTPSTRSQVIWRSGKH